MRLVAWFQIVVGVSVLGLWSVLLLGGQVPEVQAGQVDIWFHLAAELTMAGLLVVAGVAVVRRSRRATGLSAVALGLLGYSVLNSPGYYAERGDWAMVAMFAVLVLAVAASLVRLLGRTSEDAEQPTVDV